MTTTTLEIPSLRNKVSPEEWAVRVDLAACYRLVARYGWDDLVFTHITRARARAPRTSSSSTPTACSSTRSPRRAS